MSETTLQAIVLRRTNSGESDRRLTLLTSELGKVDATAKGARKANSRLGAISEPLSVATIGLAAGRKNRFITQAQPTIAFKNLRSSFDRITFAMALAESYAAVLPYEQPVPEMYELLRDSLRHLESHVKPLVAFLWCQCALLQCAGFWPSFDICVADGSPIQVAEPWISPHAGGFLSEVEALKFADRYRVRAEVLYGLTRIVELQSPPPNLKYATETLAALVPFLRHFADYPLPANEYALQMCREDTA
jgi:DNA repair protein RecO (recombination protein O)